MSDSIRSGSKRLLKGLQLGTLQTVVKLGFGFASIKVTAVYLGPAGLALVAQLMNLINLCQSVLANGALTAILRLGAEYSGNYDRRRALFSTALRLVTGSTIFCALALLAGMPWLMPWIFAGEFHPIAYIVAAVLIPFGAAAVIINAAINSNGEMTLITVGQLAVIIVGFFVFVPSAYIFGIKGALIAAGVTPAIAFAAALYILSKSRDINISHFTARLNKESLKEIGAFYPMLLVHAGAGYLSLLLVRDLAVRHLGLDGGGIWQATWKLSEQYLSLLTASVSLYFMPRLGALIADRQAFRNEVIGTVWRVMLVALAAAVLLFLTRDWVVRIVFAPSFEKVTGLMQWQLIGDVLKMGAWILSMTMTVLVRSRWYIACELLVPAAFLGFSSLLIDSIGAQAITIGYAASGVLHLTIGLIALRDILFNLPAKVSTPSKERQG